jgi:hypothetical protein
MVAIQVPQFEPEDWSEPGGGRGGSGLDVRRQAPPVRRRALPDRATRVRRRRLVALVLAVGVVFGGLAVVKAFVGGTFGSATGDPPAEPITDDVYVVQPGDSLWSIAERVADGGDPRPIVATLRERHGEAEVEIGDRLIIRPR